MNNKTKYVLPSVELLEKMEKNSLKNLIDSEEFKQSQSLLTWAVGTKSDGSTYITSLEKMPHLLIAGSTDSEINNCINNIILSVFYKAKPDEVKFVLIDTIGKISVYKNVPHLYNLSCIEPKTNVPVFNSLQKLVEIMEERYEKYAKNEVRNIKEYNEKMILECKNIDSYIVVIINELENLRLFVSKDIEELIIKLAQMARAVGIHLVIATTRLTVNVITYNIKCNFPTRLSFKVKSAEESNVILDCAGAEKLVGNGDMLFLPVSEPNPIELQCPVVSSKEIERIINFITS